MEEYEKLLDELVEAEIIIDKKMAYWDVRPSEAFPTVEIRVNDVMSSVDDVVALAGIVRGLVALCDRADGSADDCGSADDYRWELLRAANWRASRSGLTETLLSPLDGVARPAALAIAHLLDQIAPLLDQRGEREEVEALTGALLARGNGAARQREAYSRRGSLDDVIRSVTLGRDGHPPPAGLA